MDLFEFMKQLKGIASDAIGQAFDQTIDELQRELNPDANTANKSVPPVPGTAAPVPPVQQPAAPVTPAPAPAAPVPPAPAAAPADYADLSEEERDMQLAKQILARIRQETRTPVLRLELTDTKPGLCDSKVGGLPYLPADAAVPCDAGGGALRLLAQIDCTQLSALPDFPQTGLLQFWVAQNVEWGLNQEQGSRVIWHETVDPSVTEAQVQAKLDTVPKPADFDENFPVNGEFGIELHCEQDCMPACNSRFAPLFTEKFNALTLGEPITHPDDLGDDIGEMMWEALSGDGNKIGGYPAFTQGDPRSKDDPRMVMLLQLDSAAQDGYGIMWGDVGIGNFFCTPADLKARDFSNVLYTWDCG